MDQPVTPFRLRAYRPEGETKPGVIGMIGDVFVTSFARPGESFYAVLMSTGLKPEWLFDQGEDK